MSIQYTSIAASRIAGNNSSQAGHGPHAPSINEGPRTKEDDYSHISLVLHGIAHGVKCQVGVVGGSLEFAQPQDV